MKVSVQTGKPLNIECRMTRSSDNTKRWISVRGRIHQDDSGNALSMLCIVIDITDNDLEPIATEMSRAQFIGMRNSP